jgi:hypothetical protein
VVSHHFRNLHQSVSSNWSNSSAGRRPTAYSSLESVAARARRWRRRRAERLQLLVGGGDDARHLGQGLPLALRPHHYVVYLAGCEESGQLTEQSDFGLAQRYG